MLKLYVRLAWLRLTFWNIYLRLANCWMSHFGASFFFFSCLPLLLLTLFSIPRPQVSLIEMEPISPYTVFTHTRSSAVPFSLSPSWTEPFEHKNLQTHSLSLQFSHQTVNSSRNTISFWMDGNNLSEKWHIHVVPVAYMQRSLPALPEATIPVRLHVTTTCRMCFNECYPFQ